MATIPNMKKKFSEITTKHGYSADEVISALQKSIRRGKEEDAVFFAYELLVTSKECETKCWERLRVIAVEDVGLANPNLVTILAALHEMYNILSENEREDKFLQALMGVVLLVRSQKDRYIDELYNNLRDKIELEHYRREIPDYALDKHTKRGREMGRDVLHFWEIGSKLENEIPREKKELKEILKRIKEQVPDK